MSQADQQLLSLLQKAANPIQSVSLSLQLKGVFAPPQQWKLTDQANPGVFSYSLSFMQFEYSNGKVEPRKLTEVQLRAQQQAKNKKGGKKEAKQEEPPPVKQDPQAEKKRLEWEALSEQEKFYRTQQDPYKAFSLLWAEQEKKESLQGESLKRLQQSVSKKQAKIKLVRQPVGGEQEIAKIKKSKPKNLNLGQLYAANYIGTIDLSKLNEPGQTAIEVRVPIQFEGQVPAQCIKIDAQKCYALVRIQLSEPLSPLVTQVTPSTSGVLGNRIQKNNSPSLVLRLRSEISRMVRAISQQYANFFSKQKDITDDKKMGWASSSNYSNISTLKMNELNKRKDAFLQELVSSGKYALISERLVKIVKTIVVDKCRKQKKGASVTKQALQSILSELNLYFKQLLQSTLDQCMVNDGPLLHEDIVLGHEMVKNSRHQSVTSLKQSIQDRLARQTRLANQYEIANQIPQAEQKYLNIIAISQSSQSSFEQRQQYARFCLRHNKYDEAYAIYLVLRSEQQSFQQQLVLTFFQLQRNRNSQALQRLQDLQSQQLQASQKVTIHQLLSFTYLQLGQQKKAEKHLTLAEKYFLFQSNPNMRIHPINNPYVQQGPKVPKPGKVASLLSNYQSQEMKQSLLNILIGYGFSQLALRYAEHVPKSKNKLLLQAKALLGQRKYNQSLELVEELLQKDGRNQQLLTLKANISFLSERIFQCEEVYLNLLALKPEQTQAYSIYLRLGFTYLSRKSWQDAKTIFNKAVEIRSNSSIGWLGLGQAHLQLGQLNQSQQAFDLSHIYNPLSTQPTQGLKKINDLIHQRHKQEYVYFSKKEADD